MLSVQSSDTQDFHRQTQTRSKNTAIVKGLWQEHIGYGKIQSIPLRLKL